MTEQRVLRGSTATLVAYPRVSAGGPWLRSPPTSATVRISTPTASMPATETTADVESLCAELASAAAEGDTELTLTTRQTVCRGRQYLLLPEDDEAERVIVIADSDTTKTLVRLLEPLPCAVEAGTEFAGWACTADLTAAQTEEAGEGLAIWTATVDDVDVTWSQAFRIVRRMPVSALTPGRLTSSYPLVRTLRAGVDTSLERIIDAAWTHRVVPLLAAKGIPEEDVVAVDALEPLHALACVVHLAQLDPQLDREFVRGLLEEYERCKTTTLGRTDWYAAPQTDDSPPRPEPGTARLRDGIRLSR